MLVCCIKAADQPLLLPFAGRPRPLPRRPRHRHPLLRSDDLASSACHSLAWCSRCSCACLCLLFSCAVLCAAEQGQAWCLTPCPGLAPCTTCGSAVSKHTAHHHQKAGRHANSTRQDWPPFHKALFDSCSLLESGNTFSLTHTAEHGCRSAQRVQQEDTQAPCTVLARHRILSSLLQNHPPVLVLVLRERHVGV